METKKEIFNKKLTFPPCREFSDGGEYPNLHLKKSIKDIIKSIKRFVYYKKNDANVLGKSK